jgi:hypothetical protein
MPTYHKVDGGSKEWLELRLGRPTASGFGELMTLKFEPRDGQTPKTYMYARIAEAWSGNILAGFTSRATEQGKLLEDEAVCFFQMEYEQAKLGGFIVGDDGRCGCSPDALVGDDSGLEIKCPNAETHVRYLDEGKLPNDYVAQVHGSLYVSGRKSWHFLSYHRGLPPFHLLVERDESIMEKIRSVLSGFYTQYDATFARLKS